MRYGIIGYPLGHSFSPAYFTQKFNQLGIIATFESYPILQIADFPKLIASLPDLRGLSVTIPYKQAVIPLLDSVSTEAKEIGAVNCISIWQGKCIGYNTDIVGFEQSLLPLLRPIHQQALILGTGGAAHAVAFVLKKLGISFQYISRNPKEGQLAYAKIDELQMADHKLIINTTPLGMHPNIDQKPDIPYRLLTSEHLLYDLTYNPETTAFLQAGADRGAVIKNGYEMLVLQAEAAWKIWNNPATFTQQ